MDEFSETNLIPIKVGDATVYIRSTKTADVTEDVYAAGLPSPLDLLQTAREFISTFGSYLASIQREHMPAELNVTFELGVEGSAQARIPVLISGESKASAALTLKAVWKWPAEPGETTDAR